MSPLAANCTSHSNVSQMQKATFCEMLTSNEERVSERPPPDDAKATGLTG